MFAAKPPATNPRLRAFAPLCPPEWATTALAYLKEADVIQSRRQEAIPNRKPVGNLSEKAEAVPKRKNQKYAKKRTRDDPWR